MSDYTPSLTDKLGGQQFVAEAGAEIQFDAVTAGHEEGHEREVKHLGLGFWVAVVWLVVLISLCALAPWLPFVEPAGGYSDHARELISQGQDVPPNSVNWFGADDIGHDVFSQVIWGGRISLFVGVASVTFGFIIGGTLGLTSGYYRGRYEQTVVSSMDIMLAFPALVLALALVTFLSPPGTQNASLGTVTLVLTILAVPALARITRAATLTYAQREFVTAARALGARNGRIIAREILPNVIPPMAAFALIAIAIVIVAEGALSFLGLSVSTPTDTWGKLIDGGRQSLDDTPWISLCPCAVMFLTLLSFNYAGDQLRRYFEVKEGNL
jgi:peptide/nickel transport system permease protein